MKEQTVLQELIKMSNKLEFHHWFNTHKERLLQKEKEQICDGYNQGYRDAERINHGCSYPDVSQCSDATDYFTNKYL